MKRLTMALLATACALAGTDVFARRLVWTGNANDSWKNTSLWYVQSPWANAGSYPGADDDIVVSINHPLVLDTTNADNFEVLNGSKGVCLPEPTSQFRIIATNESPVTISVPIVGGYNVAVGDPSYGMVEISGSGTLYLTATGMRNYHTRIFTVNSAKVWLPQNNDLELSQYFLGNTTVSNGATLHLPTCHNGGLNNGNNYVAIRELYGDGTLTASENTEVRFTGTDGVFAGVLDTEIKLFNGGKQMLTGTNSVMTRIQLVYNAYQKFATDNGVLGVMKFGKSGEPSSIGTSSQFGANVRGATYLYLGQGEETDKRYNIFGTDAGYDTLDGGATGGLVFTGTGGFRAVSYPKYNCVVCLSGSNTVPCVIDGQFNENDTSYHVAILKKGTGTWRFSDPTLRGVTLGDYRSIRGSISVDEGVLQFDTITPRGEYSSIGTASLLKGTALGEWDNLPYVDWAFSLGGTNSTLTGLAEGTLEYTGTTTGLIEGRRVRLEADGRLRANGPKKLRYRMAETTSARAKTLSLDGEALVTNEVRGVFDTATHPVSIVKEGGGTWLLGGKSPLHGDLKVKGGKLIVENYPLGSQYTWFKFTIKNLFDPVKPSSSKVTASVRFLGLYDADGLCHTANTKCAEDMRAAAIEPGEAGYATMRKFSKGAYSASTAPQHNHNPTNMFRYTPVYDANPYNLSGKNSGYYPRLAEETTWIPMVVRLTNGAPAVASYDWSITYGFESDNKGGFHWAPNIWSLEGSVDGTHWENLNPDGGDFSITTNDYPHLKGDVYFVYSKGYMGSANFTTRAAGNAYWHSGGFAIRGTCTNSYVTLSSVRSVQVDGGATLEIKGEGDVTFSSLSVDASKGCGTIKGGSFAADGTVSLENYPKDGMARAMPFDLSGTTDAENISHWNVEVDGAARSRWHVKYADGQLTIFPPGMNINIS